MPNEKDPFVKIPRALWYEVIDSVLGSEYRSDWELCTDILERLIEYGYVPADYPSRMAVYELPDAESDRYERTKEAFGVCPYWVLSAEGKIQVVSEDA